MHSFEPKLSPESGRRIFIAGLAIFLLAKLYLLVATYLPSGIPRLGDDSLIYLWKGKLSLMGDGQQYAALRDILALEERVPPGGDNVRTAVSQVYSGTVRPLGDLFYGAIGQTGLSLKWAAFLSELIGLGLMTFAIAWLLLAIFGQAATGFALMLLAFAVFPNQGIYSYIPSTTAMSLGLILWGYLLRRGAATSPWLGLASAFVISSVHPIGKLYSLLAPFFHGYALGGWRELFSRRNVLLYAAIAAGVSLTWLWPVAWPPFALPQHVLTGGPGLDPEVFHRNASYTLSWLPDPIVRKNLLLMLFALGGLVFFRKRVLPGRSWLILVSLVALCFAALFHDLPGYPGELFSRLFVPTAIVLAGVGGETLAVLWERRTRGARFVLGIYWLGLMLAAAIWVNSYAFSKLNEAKQIISEVEFKRQLDALPQSSVILYPEMDFSLNTSLLLGGYRYGAVNYRTLAGRAELSAILQERRPSVMIVPNLPALNSLSFGGEKTLEPRRLGFFLKKTARLVIRPADGRNIQNLYFYIDNPGEPANARVRDNPGGVWRDVGLPGGAHGWVDLWHRVPTDYFEIELPQRAIWVEGISDDPTNGLRWPWAMGAEVTYETRRYYRESQRYHTLSFSPAALLAASGATELLPWVGANQPVYADEGGFVWLRTIYR